VAKIIIFTIAYALFAIFLTGETATTAKTFPGQPLGKS
jgi:hypothetical protein